MFAFASDGGPRPVFTVADQSGSNGVVDDVLERILVVLFVVDHPRGEPLAEERALPAEAGVVLSRVVALEPLDCRGEGFDRGVDERVVMRPHQAVGVEPDAPALDALLEQRDERPVVVRVAEQPGLVDGVRRQVEIAVRELGAEDSRHASTLRLRPVALARPTHFLPTLDTPSRAWASVRHSPWPEGPRR